MHGEPPKPNPGSVHPGKPGDAASEQRLRCFHKRFFGILILANALIIFLVWLLYAFELSRQENRLIEREISRTKLFSTYLGREAVRLAKSAMLFSRHPGVDEYFVNPDPTSRALLEQEAINLIESEPDLDQVRLINRDGREIFRIDRGRGLIPQDQLQDKSKSVYFRESIQTQPGEVYLSRMDLNVENDALEQPYRPMIRAAVIVPDGRGQPHGIIVLNTLARRFLSSFDLLFPDLAYRFRILNSEGDWLRADDPTHEWGFQLPDRRPQSMAVKDPALWEIIRSQPAGYTRHRGAGYAWETVNFSEITKEIPVRIVTNEQSYLVVSEISASEWKDTFASLAKIFRIFLIIVLILANAVAVIFRCRTIERRKTLAALREAATVAEESSRLKSQFLANISHEIRTPMNGVIGMTEILLDSELSVEQRHFAHTIRSSADTLMSLLNDILDFAKIEAGMLTLEDIPFDLRDPVETTVSLLAGNANAMGIEISCCIDPDAPVNLIGDPSRLQQVLLNLVSNAIKFTENGEVKLNVSVDALEHASAGKNGSVRLRFEIRDTGIGIQRDVIEKLFKPFVQADGSTSRKFGGTGLGLAISRELVERMGGMLTVESTPDVGSVFAFSLCFDFLPASTDAHQSTTYAGVHILVVDDNATNREIFRRYLESLKILVTTVRSAVEAMAAIEQSEQNQSPFQAAIIDMCMPDMNGEALAEAIRNRPSTRHLPILIVSSTPGLLTTSRQLDLGVDASVSKPVRQSQLFHAIGKVLSAAGYGTANRIELQEPPPTALPLILSGYRILTAEDNAPNRLVLKLQLKKFGGETDFASNGREAVESATKQAYQIIFMDWQMPEVDGVEATRLIRAFEAGHPDRPRAYIIACTADASKEDEAMCLAAGMDNYLSKPVTLDKLGIVLQRALEALG